MVSTNGTVLEGKRLTKNVAVELTDTSRLQLGLLELTATPKTARKPES